MIGALWPDSKTRYLIVLLVNLSNATLPSLMLIQPDFYHTDNYPVGSYHQAAVGTAQQYRFLASAPASTGEPLWPWVQRPLVDSFLPKLPGQRLHLQPSPPPATPPPEPSAHSPYPPHPQRSFL